MSHFRDERPRDKRPTSVQLVHDTLYAKYGPQHWWPADSRFEIMVGAVLTQNTAWTNVEKAIANLRDARCLDAKSIVEKAHSDLARLLKPSGYFQVKATRLQNLCRWHLANGGFEQLSRMDTSALRDSLLQVNGIGPESADAIVLYAFERPVFVIDAYTRRLFSRLGLVRGDEDYEELRCLFETSLAPDAALYNRYHALIVCHGKDACRKRPRCGECCFQEICEWRVSSAMLSEVACE